MSATIDVSPTATPMSYELPAASRTYRIQRGAIFVPTHWSASLDRPLATETTAAAIDESPTDETSIDENRIGEILIGEILIDVGEMKGDEILIGGISIGKTPVDATKIDAISTDETWTGNAPTDQPLTAIPFGEIQIAAQQTGEISIEQTPTGEPNRPDGKFAGPKSTTPSDLARCPIVIAMTAGFAIRPGEKPIARKRHRDATIARHPSSGAK
jgi:hypothetical protein